MKRRSFLKGLLGGAALLTIQWPGITRKTEYEGEVGTWQGIRYYSTVNAQALPLTEGVTPQAAFMTVEWVTAKFY